MTAKTMMAKWGGRGVALFLCAAVLGCGAQRSEQHRQEGDAYFRLGKYDEAAESYRKAEIANPDNSMAKVGIGRYYALRGQYEEAAAAFRKAMELDPALESACSEGIYVLLKQNKTQEAMDLATQFEQVNPQRGGLFRSMVLLRTGRAADAVAALEQLRNKHPDAADIRIALAAALILVRRADDAEKELRYVLESIDSESIAARLALTDVYQAQGKIDLMVSELENLVQQNPDQLGLRLGLARGLVLAGRTDEAEAIARDLISKNEAPGWAQFILGSALLQKQRYTEAVPYLESAESLLPDYPPVSQALALAKYGSANPAQEGQAPMPVAGIQAAGEDTWQSLWRQAAMARLLQNRDQFLKENAPNVRETLAAAALFTSHLELAEQIAAPLDENVPIRKLIAAIRGKDMASALKLFEQWSEQNDELRILRENAFGFTLALGGNRARAISVFSKCVATWPDNGVSLFNIAQVCRQAGMPEFAAQALQRLVRRYPDNMDALTLLYAVYREGNMMTEARSAAEMFYARFPNTREAIVNLAQAYLDSHDLTMAQSLLERGLQANPGDPVLQAMQVSVLLMAGKTDEAAQLLAQVPATPEQAPRLDIYSALCRGLKGNWREVLDTMGPEAPATSGLRLVAAAAAIKTGALDKAVELLKTADTTKMAVENVILRALGQSVSVTEQDAPLAQALAARQELAGQFAFAVACQTARLHDDAYALMLDLANQIGGNPVLLQLMFMNIEQAQRMTDRGKEAHDLAQRYADVPVAWLGLARVLRLVGDLEGEKQALQKAVEIAPTDIAALFQLASFHDRQKDLASQIDCYRRILEIVPDDTVANNNLAYCLLMTGGDKQEALDRASRAAPALRNPMAYHTLALAQLSVNDLENSEKNFIVALEMRPGDPTMMLDYGKLLIAKGQKDEGLRQIKLAIQYAEQLGLEFTRKPEALALVRRETQTAS